MLTWNTYLVEQQRKQDEIAQVMHDRIVRSAAEDCESPLTTLTIKVLESVGNRLVEWGYYLQCRCAAITMANSKRAI
jgi:hypothetical protein